MTEHNVNEGDGPPWRQLSKKTKIPAEKTAMSKKLFQRNSLDSKKKQQTKKNTNM